jgi:predicted nucleic-acid-binding Zn-ribbon protein
MPHHGPRPCSNCGYMKFKLVKDCGMTGIIKCVKCGKEKRVKWSQYMTHRRFEVISSSQTKE